MSNLVNESLLEAFETLLSSAPPLGKQKEQVVQDFLEEHTEFIPTPNLLNHHLHLGVVVSKFPLSTELTTDYLYITKSSDVWRIVLVELESPDKRIFNDNTKLVNTSAEFNAALNQVRSWKRFVAENRNEVLRHLAPLLQPAVMFRNPVEFHYSLIIGRSEDKNLTADRRGHIRGLINESGIDILSYDSVANWYKNDQRYEKNVLRLTGSQFEFKYMHVKPRNVFAYLGPDVLVLSVKQQKWLMGAGYNIAEWRKGKLLELNGKQTIASAKKKKRS